MLYDALRPMQKVPREFEFTPLPQRVLGIMIL